MPCSILLLMINWYAACSLLVDFPFLRASMRGHVRPSVFLSACLSVCQWYLTCETGGLSILHAFSHSFFRSIIHLFDHLFIHAFDHLFVHSFIHLFFHLFFKLVLVHSSLLPIQPCRWWIQMRMSFGIRTSSRRLSMYEHSSRRL